MDNIYEILKEISDNSYSASDAINMLGCKENNGKISDTDLIKKIIVSIDDKPDKEELWNHILLRYIDADSIDDHCFDYFWENNICLNTLSHMELKDKYLKKLLRYFDEAYIFLARRYYKYDKYSVYEFAELMSKCRYESVFYDLLMNEKNIIDKGNLLHNIILNSTYLSEELKSFSGRIYTAKVLFCTDDIEMIKKYYNKKDHIYLAAISQNVSAPENILCELTRMTGIKFAAHIRENSRETLRIKAMLSKATPHKERQ